MRATFGWIWQSILNLVGVKGFGIWSKRWMVERTFAWINKFCRNSKDDERNPLSSIVMVSIAMIARILNPSKNEIEDLEDIR